MRRFATREVRDHIAVELLHEIDPGGTATGDERKLALAFEEALLELGRLFNDGEVGAEVGVEDSLKAHAAK